MKIIKAGNPYRYTCNKCGCIFEIDKDEICKKREYEFNRPYEEFIREIEYIKCPTCENEIKIGEKNFSMLLNPDDFKLGF